MDKGRGLSVTISYGGGCWSYGHQAQHNTVWVGKLVFSGLSQCTSDIDLMEKTHLENLCSLSKNKNIVRLITTLS